MTSKESIVQIGEIADHGVFIYDHANRRFRYINDRFAKIFSFTVAQLMEDASLLLPLIFTEEPHYVESKYQELLSKRFLTFAEFRLNTDGLAFINCHAYVLAEGLICGFVHDTTREKEHEEYMVNFGAKKDTLLSMMAHNLSSHLYLSQNILGAIENKHGAELPNDISRSVQILQSSAQECIDIVNDLLREEHKESETIFVKVTRFNVLEKIISIIDKFAETNKAKSFRLVTGLKQLNVSTDSVKFFQALHNLISNSVKFTPDGGIIEVRVLESADSFTIVVEDNGIGIPVPIQELIFTRHQGRLGLNQQQSSGMGLHIVKTLVTLLKGTVEFESKEGIGSTFSIILPKL